MANLYFTFATVLTYCRILTSTRAIELGNGIRSYFDAKGVWLGEDWAWHRLAHAARCADFRDRYI